MFAKKSRKQEIEEFIDEGTDTLTDFVDHLAPYLAMAKDRATEAKDKVVPLVQDHVVPLVHDAAEKARPVVEGARERVTGVYDDQIKPKVFDWLDEAAADPRVVEANKRGHALLAAAKGDLRLPEPAPRMSKGRMIIKGLTITAILGAIAIAIRQFLAPKDDGWTPQQPSSAYQPRASFEEDVPVDVAGTESAESVVTDEGLADLADLPDAEVIVDEDLEVQVPADGESAWEADDELAELVEEADPEGDNPFRYGEGSYVGSEPPEGYTIKGNERSMKYHTAESAGYDRTMTDVWFGSEESAQRAGFTRAQR